MQRLAVRFPNSATDFTLLYFGSTWLPRDLRALLWLAHRRRIPVVLNQNGVGYPAWAGERTDAVNRPPRQALLAADHVLYQSEFCKRSADVFLGSPSGTSEVLYNAVDVDRFVPAPGAIGDGPVLLAGGDQTQADYRLDLALRTFAHVLAAHPAARLIVTGQLLSDPGPLVSALGLREHVDFVGRYNQAEAPAVYRRAHLLLHTQMNDSCPSVVLEAMASGLPVVYPASGGTVELVGDVGGVGVPHDASWDRARSAGCRGHGRGRRAGPARAARLFGGCAFPHRRAVRARPWLERHAELFRELTEPSA